MSDDRAERLEKLREIEAKASEQRNFNIRDDERLALAARDCAFDYVDKKVAELRSEIREVKALANKRPSNQPARKGISLKAFRALPEEQRKGYRFSQEDKNRLTLDKISEVEEGLIKAYSELKEVKKSLDGVGLRYEGVFEDGKSYRQGSVITDHGSLWIAKQTTTGRPPSDSWQLAVKSR